MAKQEKNSFRVSIPGIFSFEVQLRQKFSFGQAIALVMIGLLFLAGIVFLVKHS